jgi:hypothetical protein
MGMALVGVVMFAFTACIDLTRPGAGSYSGETIPEGMGLACITLGGDGERTVVPNIGGYYFTLDFTSEGKTAVNKTLSNGLSLTVALESAVWNLEVKGYTNSSKTSLKVLGSAIVSITAGTESSVDVYLMPDFSSEGRGSLSYSIGLPSTASGIFYLYPIDASGISRKIGISASAGGSVSNTLSNLPEGSYLALIDLYDDGNNTATAWTRAVHIYAGLSTSLTYTFSGSDFFDCPPVIEGASLWAKLYTALDSPSGAYTIVLDGTETDLVSFMPKILNVTENKNIIITIRGNGNKVQLGSKGSLFTLEADSGSSLTLVLQDLTLSGLNSNNASLVRVNSGGTLEMKAGAVIIGNTSSSPYGGGVYINGGTFTMSDGTVSGNTSSRGGGVYINGGTFNMSGGTVSDNTASAYSSSYGGGVYVESGTFSMNGGTINGNYADTTSTSSSSTPFSYGGGVYVKGGTFSMSGGAVSGNYVVAIFSFSYSTYSYCYGGGVYVEDGAFSMIGGTISDNFAAAIYSYGGGVYVGGGTFSMSEGAISGNSAIGAPTSSWDGFTSNGNHGGGVYVANNGMFSMSGGAVTGNISNKYVSGSGYGREVLVNGTFKLSGDARPERVFLSASNRFVIISGPLSGGAVPINLGITSSTSLSSWIGKQILRLDDSYISGDLANLKEHFTLGNAALIEYPYKETLITGYKIDNSGLFVVE